MTETILHHTSSLDGLLERLPPDPRLRGKEFERVTKWFLETDPGYAWELKQVWLWDDWPGRWGSDIGIDLVAETQEGKLWAIQAKCYDPESQVPTSEVDSFISASSRPEFDHRLLITTGRLSKNAEYKLTHQEKSTAFLLYHELTESPVDWLAYLDESRPALPDKKTPRPHQQRAIDDVIEGFSANDRGRLIMACGTGKTLVGVWVAERLKSARTLVLMPSLSLVNQVSREWQANSTEPFRGLFVCSDQTADDNFVSSTGELGHAVTTDPGDIQRFMSGDGTSVVFSTYQSSPQIAAAQASGAPAFDLVIADEAHHCAGKVDSAFATVLAAHSLKASRRLFMTATPRYLSRRVKDVADQSDIQVSSMDDLEVFGPELHVLTFGQAIEQDLLSDYQVLILGVTDAEVQRLVDDRTLVQLFGEGPTTDAESQAALIGTIKAIKNYDLNHIVTFHSRVKRAKDFSSTLVEVNDVLPNEYAVSDLWTEHVSGNMPTAVRASTLQKFRQKPDGVSLLSNARCLGEGVDVRAIDGVGFIDPRKSNIDIVQAVGRAMRKSDESKIGTIVLPILIDDLADNDVDEQLNSSRFSAIWGVLNALRAHDEVLAEQMDQLRFQMGRHGRTVDSLTDKIIIDMPTSVGIEFHQALETRIINTTTASWEYWIGLLERFIEREGHASVPGSYMEGDSRLGRWVNHQRTWKNQGILSPRRVAKLESLKGWVWNEIDAKWEVGFAALERYAKREGHSLVPQNHTEDKVRLGVWLTTQRRNKKKLSDEKISRLENLPDWSWNTLESNWRQGYAALIRFVERKGHSGVPDGYILDGFTLGTWVSTQRTRKNRMSVERVSLLEKLPDWQWDVRGDAWDRGFAALETYIAREGHSRIPQTYFEGDVGLGRWVNHQRSRRNSLSPEKLDKLNNLAGWVWKELPDVWELKFQALLEYVEREGHARVPGKYIVGDVKLGQWVSNCRFRSERLTVDQKTRLSRLPGWKWPDKK